MWFCEPIVPNLEHFFQSLIDVYYKLIDLNFGNIQKETGIVEGIVEDQHD